MVCCGIDLATGRDRTVYTMPTIDKDLIQTLRRELDVPGIVIKQPYGDVEAVTVEMAMIVLTKALKADRTPGSYYYGWQSNIACTIMDNSDIEHDQANDIAKKFLEMLIK